MEAQYDPVERATTICINAILMALRKASSLAADQLAWENVLNSSPSIALNDGFWDCDMQLSFDAFGMNISAVCYSVKFTDIKAGGKVSLRFKPEEIHGKNSEMNFKFRFTANSSEMIRI